jgi:uncharacterized protein
MKSHFIQALGAIRTGEFSFRMGQYEENYELCQQLFGDVRQRSGALRASVVGLAPVYLEIVEQASYTTVLRLTHAFEGANGVTEFDPAAWIRLYHDSKQAEITHCLIGQHIRKLFDSVESPANVVRTRARLNTLLSKWLRYLKDGALSADQFVPCQSMSGLDPDQALLYPQESESDREVQS